MVEEAKISQALREALSKFPARGAHEPQASILKVEPRPTFGVGNVRMPSNALVDIEEGAPKYEPPVKATVRFIELCLPPGEQVLTLDGPKPIEQISVGEQVLTHKGRFRPVSRIFSRNYEGELVSVRSAGSFIETTSTPNHPYFMTERKTVGSHDHYQFMFIEQWLEASQLVPRHKRMTMFPKILLEEDMTDVFISAPPKLGRKQGPLPRSYRLPLSDALLGVIGLYLAEGSSFSRVPGRRDETSLRFSFGKSLAEYSLASALVYALRSLGFKPRLTPTAYGWIVLLDSYALAQWLAREFGKRATGKKVPFWCVLLPCQKLEVLLYAYLKGDGNKTHFGWRSSTVSSQLALALKLIGEKLNYVCSVFRASSTNLIEDRYVNAKQLYVNHFSLKESRATHQRYGQSFRSVVKSVRSYNYSGPVYNLEVDEDNSYCTFSHALHNCRDFLLPVLEEKKVKVNDEEVMVRRAIREDNKFKTSRQERCFNRLITEPVLKCSARLADHIESLTPEKERTATTRLQSQVEGFYACVDESENTFIAAAVLEQSRDQVKQIVSQIEVPFDVRVPASGLSEEEAGQLLERQKKRAAQRAARGEPVIRRAIDPSTGRTVDQWGMPSFIVPVEVKVANRERYCPPFNQTIGCSPPIPKPEPASETEAVTLTPEEVELVAARQAAVELPELARGTPRVKGVFREEIPVGLPSVEVLSPEAQRVLAAMRRRPELAE